VIFKKKNIRPWMQS